MESSDEAHRGGPPPAERRQLILDAVRANAGVGINELSASLGVSAATVRRDLALLAGEGKISRTYGGAVAGPRPIELRLAEKEHSCISEKDEIATAAAVLVERGDVLLLDAGTSTGRLARQLRHRDGITVVTNGTNTIFTLAEAEGIEVVVLGGRLRHTSQALIGPLAEEALRYLYVDKVFLGVDGVVARRGIGCPTPEQAVLKAAMAARARKVFILADHTKLGRDSFPYWAPIDGSATVITDSRADAAAVAALRGDPHLSVLKAPAYGGKGPLAPPGARPHAHR